jgi:hypothetical protein
VLWLAASIVSILRPSLSYLYLVVRGFVPVKFSVVSVVSLNWLYVVWVMIPSASVISVRRFNRSYLYLI